MGDERSGRTLETARAVLQVLKKMMAQSPDGLRPDEVAGTLRTSTATATYLLDGLCREGFAERSSSDGLYRLTEPMTPPTVHPGVPAEDLGVAVEELYARTNERTSLATAEERHVVIHEARGRQGLLSTTRARFDEDRERLIPIAMAVATAASHRGRSQLGAPGLTTPPAPLAVAGGALTGNDP